MVAPTAPPPETSAQPPQPTYAQQTPIRGRSAPQRLIRSLTRLASIQTQLAILQAKLSAQRLIMFAVLYAMAAAIALAGIVFLYLGCFKLLCLVMADYWAFLIFAGLHALAALAFFLRAQALTRAEPPSSPEPAPETPSMEPQSQEATL